MNVYDAMAAARFASTSSAHSGRDVAQAGQRRPSGTASSQPQPLKYLVVNDPKLLDDVFACTRWAAQLSDGTPKDGERPTAYVVLLVDKEIVGSDYKGYDIDAGAAGANLMLAAVGEGLGSCWIGSVDRERLRAVLQIPDRYIVHTMISLGYPAEKSVAEDAVDGSVRYYRDASGTLHVPKRPLDEVMFLNELS